MIEEYARHNGHADLIRESIDGQTGSDPLTRGSGAATDDDWPQIWPFFSAIVAAGETYAFPEDLTVETGRGWWMEQPPGHTVVLEDDGRILGSGQDGSQPARPRRPRRHRVVHGRPRGAGRGVGRALASYVVDWHREHGFAGIQFNAVVETNTAAVHLWQALGLRDRRHRARRVPLGHPRARRAARDVPAPWPERQTGPAKPGRYSVRISRNGASAPSWLSTPTPPSQVRWISR